MSVQFDSSRNRWVVRWYEAGRQRSRRFVEEQPARAFDAQQRRDKAAGRRAEDAELAGELARLRARVELIEQELPDDARTSGVSAYATRQGVRWRVALPQSDGSLTTRRGYPTREAACRAREQLVVTPAPAAEASFARYWQAWLADKRAYVTDGAHEDLETHGRKRLLPHFAHLPIGQITESHIREWMARMTAALEAGELSAKTINNARAALSGALGDAARQGLLPRNPCRYVAALPVEHHELDYLRLDEIDRYLSACPSHYRPIAQLLIGTGARISEALALTWLDIDLEHGTVQIQRQRARRGDDPRPPKNKHARTVLIGPRLIESLRALRDSAHPPNSEADWLFICPRPRRGRYANRPDTNPPSRRTVHEWHHHTLTSAGLRPMPLHALRHTAAASWLTTGHSLIFVARQLGHRSITTTEQHSGHLELNLFTNALAATDNAITRAGPHSQ
jgi:integrase